MTGRPTILVALGCFTPSNRVSGPNSSLIEAVKALSDRFEFRIIGEADEGEAVHRWHQFEGCNRIAVRRGPAMGAQLWKIVRDTPHDLVVCNGFFDYRVTLPMLLLHRSGGLGSPLLLAPRGEFSPGAFALGGGRKRVYLAALRAAGLLGKVRFQATDAEEAALIGSMLPNAEILIGPNIRRLTPLPEFRARGAGAPLRIAFASRIDRKKNLAWGLRLLRESKVPLRFDIHGPVSDAETWRECQAIIESMPAHVEVRYQGSTPPDEIIPALSGNDLFFLPTRGENFGHAIADALLAGTPALIADTTPWRGLMEARAGADLPLGDPSPWHAFIAMFSALSDEEVRGWRSDTRAFVERRLDEQGTIAQLANCFTAAMGRETGTIRQHAERVKVDHVRN